MKHSLLSLFALCCNLIVAGLSDAQWKKNTGLNESIVYCLLASGSEMFAGTDRGVFVASEDGTSWSAANTGLNNTAVTALAKSGNNLYAGTSCAGLFLSTNVGMNWSAINDSLLQPDKYIASLAVTGDTIFVGSLFTMSISTNGGVTWSATDIHLCEPHAIAFKSNVVLASLEMIEILSVTPDVPSDKREQRSGALLKLDGSDNIADTRGNGIYRSTDNGLTWASANSSAFASSFAISDSIVYAGCYNGGVTVSTDNGASWMWPDTGLKGKSVLSIVVYDDNVFAGTSNGVYLSTDRGSTWQDVSAGLTYRYINTLAVWGGTIYAGTSVTGLWQRPLSEMVTKVLDKNSANPVNCRLAQNYPNPFNPATTISYHLPTNSFVVLKVYDILGREVETLTDERQAAGTHSLKFEATNLPSGVYFYRLEAGAYHETRKLLLLK